MARSALLLDAALAELLAATGARAVRVVDGRTGAVVATADDDGVPDPGDDPGVVAGLVRDAVSLGSSGEGGLDDVVVSTERSVHLLRPVSVAFLHLRLDADDPDAAVAAARRALAAPRLAAAVHDVVAAPAPLRLVGTPALPRHAGPRIPSLPHPRAAEPPGAGVPAPGRRVRPLPAGLLPPEPRHAGTPGPGPLDTDPPVRPDPAGRPDPAPLSGPDGAVPASRRARAAEPARQPALAVLTVTGTPSRAGALASVALAELTEAALPRRRRAAVVPAAPAGVVTAGLPERVWARDLDTMQRLALGLRRLS